MLIMKSKLYHNNKKFLNKAYFSFCSFSENEKDEKSNATNEETKVAAGANP